MAELVDAADSKSALSDKVLVQVRLEVPKHTTPILGVVFLFLFKHLCWFDNSLILKGSIFSFIELFFEILL